MRKLGRVLVVACLLTAVGGCRSTSTVDAAAATSSVAASAATPAPTATVTPSPTPTVDRQAEWGPVLDRAQLTIAEAGPPTTDRYEAVFGMPCGRTFTATRWADRAWTYPSAKHGFIAFGVAAYDPEPGAAIATQGRASLKACTTWRASDGQLELKVVDELTVKRPSSVDGVFAYCYRMDFIGGQMAGHHIYVCDAFLAHGHLLANIGSYADTLAPVQEHVKTLIPLAATALTRAGLTS